MGMSHDRPNPVACQRVKGAIPLPKIYIGHLMSRAIAVISLRFWRKDKAMTFRLLLMFPLLSTLLSLVPPPSLT